MNSIRTRSMFPKFWLLMLATISALLMVVLFFPKGTADAYNSVSCGSEFVHWDGSEADFHWSDPPTNGQEITEGWWRSEIIYASVVWEDAGTDFKFPLNATDNQWYKRTRNTLSEIAITTREYTVPSCHLDLTRAYFNTRYSFAICDPCNSGTFDVRTVAIHEFGHWLTLNHIPTWKVWDNDCAMWDGWRGTNHGLCGHDEAGIQEIYGAS